MTRQSKFENWDELTQSQVRFEQMSPDGQVHQKLEQLQEFIRQLANTPHGQADLRRRAQRLGLCKPEPDECARAFYGRLRRWLDVDLDVTTRSSTDA